MNKFYRQPILLQWVESLIMAILGFYSGLILVVCAYSNPFCYLLLLFYVPVAQFSFTPLFRITGIYTYYSPMLLGYMANKHHIDLHFGTSFDYLFLISTRIKRQQIKNKLFINCLDGLLAIIAAIESGDLPAKVQIQASSYFFNERTLEKIGFRSVRVSLLSRLNLIVNLIDLYWMYALSKGKLAFPPIFEVKHASISGRDLVLNKKKIADLNAKFLSRSQDH